MTIKRGTHIRNKRRARNSGAKSQGRAIREQIDLLQDQDKAPETQPDQK